MPACQISLMKVLCSRSNTEDDQTISNLKTQDFNNIHQEMTWNG